MTLCFAKLLVSDAKFLCMELPTAAPWKTGCVPEWNSGLCGWAWGVHGFHVSLHVVCAACVQCRLLSAARAVAAGLCCDRDGAGAARELGCGSLEGARALQ